MRLTMYRKMLIGFGIIILFMIAVNAALLRELHSFSSTIRVILSSDVRSMEGIRQLRTQLDEEERHARKFLVSKDSIYLTLFNDLALQFERQHDSVIAALTDRRDQAVLEHVGSTHLRLFHAVRGEGPASETPSFTPLTDQMIADTVALLRARLGGLILSIKDAIASSLETLEDSTDRSFNLAVALSAFAVLGTIIVALIIVRTITRPLNTLIDGTRRIARGEFQPILLRTRDEMSDLADAFNDMSAALKLSNEVRADMMQHISHEIRIPLQSMHSAYYLMVEQIRGPINERQRQLLDMIRANIDRIADFSNQFLDLSKIEAGRMEFHLQTVDLSTVVAQAVTTAQAPAAEKGITIDVTSQPIPPVRADAAKIEQALHNLLSNAVKYTNRGGSVTVKAEPSPGGVTLSVRDTGIGIDPEDLPHVFTKFYQAKGAHAARQNGTGLGLTLVKAIVEHHGGTVSAVSSPGKGSTFSIELPVESSSQRYAEREMK